jgi:multiple sugar transport system substrate-binding protein
MTSSASGAAFTRRTLLGAGVSAAVVGALAACSTSSTAGSGKASQPLKFWNQPWGGPQFLVQDQKITNAYKPKSGFGKATYRQVQWANFAQTYATAVAANTGPAVSSGGGTQAFLFESQGKIAYADNLLESWKKNGIYDDFLPGLVDTLKVEKGYAAVPYNLDMRPIWYNPDLLDKAGADVPTDWQGWLDAAAALKKIGVYGYGISTGAGSYVGGHAIVSAMINNGGGLFDEKNEPNCVTPENIQAVDFILEMAKKGYIDPRSIAYTDANDNAQWSAGKFGIGVWSAALPASVTGSVSAKLKVMSPLTGPTGKKGALFFPNNIMMYTNTPSQAASEAFLTYYYKNMAPLWTQKTGIGVPPLKSIATSAAYTSDPNAVKIVNEWQPISKTWAQPGSNSLFLGVTKVDGTQPMTNFAQQVIGGKTDAKTALTSLQNALKTA